MKNFINEMIDRVPYFTLIFSVTIVYSAIIKVLTHNTSSDFCLFIVEFACCLVGWSIINYLVELIPFKHYATYHIVNALACYLFFMGCGYLFYFYGSNLIDIISFSLEFIVLYIVLTIMIIKNYRRKSKQINDLIQKKQQ